MATICDVCKVSNNSKDINITNIHHNIFSKERSFDLCSTCYKSFIVLPLTKAIKEVNNDTLVHPLPAA